VHKALYGTPAKPGFQVSEQRVAKVKKQIYKPEYKALKEQIAKIRGNSPTNTISSEGMPEMVVTPPNPNRQRTSGVNAIIRLGTATFEPEEIAVPDGGELIGHMAYSIFQLTKVSYAASLLYDNCAIIYVSNILKGIINLRDTINENVIFVNDIRSIMAKVGTKIYPQLLNDGIEGFRNKDLVLNNCVYIPGFHVNIISGDLLEKLGFRKSWDHKMYYKNVLLLILTLRRQKELLVAKYSTSPYFRIPKSTDLYNVFIINKSAISLAEAAYSSIICQTTSAHSA
jgi:hypothetical protein